MKTKTSASRKQRSKRFIKVRAADVTKVINALSLVVVSMDRIGSHCDDIEEGDRELGRYLRELPAFQLLAKARGILSQAYESQSTKTQTLRAESNGENLPYWRAAA